MYVYYNKKRGKQLIWNTHTSQSIVNRRETSSAGRLMAANTIRISTKAALGMLALATLAAVAVTLKYIQLIKINKYYTLEFSFPLFNYKILSSH